MKRVHETGVFVWMMTPQMCNLTYLERKQICKLIIRRLSVGSGKTNHSLAARDVRMC